MQSIDTKTNNISKEPNQDKRTNNLLDIFLTIGINIGTSIRFGASIYANTDILALI